MPAMLNEVAAPPSGVCETLPQREVPVSASFVTMPAMLNEVAAPPSGVCETLPQREAPVSASFVTMPAMLNELAAPPSGVCETLPQREAPVQCEVPDRDMSQDRPDCPVAVFVDLSGLRAKGSPGGAGAHFARKGPNTTRSTGK